MYGEHKEKPGGGGGLSPPGDRQCRNETVTN